jgi:hypothetical protein
MLPAGGLSPISFSIHRTRSGRIRSAFILPKVPKDEGFEENFIDQAIHLLNMAEIKKLNTIRSILGSIQYSGEPEIPKIVEFINSLEEAWKLIDPDEGACMRYLGLSFKEQALHWWRTLETKPVNFASLKTQLIAQFIPQSLSATLKWRFEDIRQDENEPVQALILRLKQAAAMAGITLTESLLLDRLQRALAPKYWIGTNKSTGETLKALIEHCEGIEYASARANPNRDGVVPPKPGFGQPVSSTKPGIILTEERSTANRPSDHRNTSLNNSSVGSGTRVRRCYGCNQVGHIRAQCPWRPPQFNMACNNQFMPPLACNYAPYPTTPNFQVPYGAPVVPYYGTPQVYTNPMPSPMPNNQAMNTHLTLPVTSQPSLVTNPPFHPANSGNGIRE